MTVTPAVPVDAATVILAREVAGAAGWECFMVRRHVKSDFAADVYVFPGGKVDPTDRDVSAEELGAPDLDLLPLRLAAIRELFEEAGVLLAYDRQGELVRIESADAAQYAEWRRRLHSGELPIIDVARERGLRLAVDRVHPFSRWITPEAMPRRFDTYFFIAAAPPGQEPLHDARETTEGTWISPGEALRRYAAGRFPLVFATMKQLDRLAGFRTLDALLESTRRPNLEPVIPRAANRGGETVFLLPGEPGYDA